ncbi:MAG: VCBS repeat-containing protein, partial [Armatimonadota bacterium]
MSASHGSTRISIAVAVVALAVLTAAPARTVTLQSGWPQTTGFWVTGSPALADLDGDGDLEVVVGSDDGYVYAWHHDGTAVAGWPQTTGGQVGTSTAVGDLEGDGSLELLVGCRDMYVYAWHGDGIPVPGWPQKTGAQVDSSPALGDLDGDGDLEVVVGSMDGDVYAWHPDGTPVTGWPRSTADGVQSSPALGDLDGDGDLEVVVGSWDGYVYAWHGDGTPVAGWPESTGDTVMSSPALGDLDGDGYLEVVVGSLDHNIYAWHGDGMSVAGWPQVADSVVSSSPALGDLDGDGDLEVVVGSSDFSVYAWHHDGTPVGGWPRSTAWSVRSSPALGDLDGDGYLEVVVGSEDNNVYAWHGDGTAVAGWPQSTGYWVISSPTLGDLDGDGDLEVVVGSLDNSVYAWTCEVPTTDPLPWPMFHHDMRRTGCYRDVPVTRGRLAGQVRDSGTTMPISGATIEAHLGGEPQASTVSDSNGMYMIPGLPAGEYLLVASKYGYATQTKASIVVIAGETTIVNFDLELGAWIIGQVRERDTTINLANATVAAYLDGQLIAMTTTSAGGYYHIETATPSSEYIVSAAKWGYETQTKWHINVVLGQPTYVNFRLAKAPVLKGQVRNRVTGEPVSDAEVVVYREGSYWRRAYTQPPYGIYGFYLTELDLDPGTYKLGALKSGYVAQYKWITIVEGETTYCNFNLEPVTWLKGQVRDGAAQGPLPGATVDVFKDGLLWKSTSSGSHWGIYEIYLTSHDGLPANDCIVRASKQGYVRQYKWGVDIPLGEATYVNFN